LERIVIYKEKREKKSGPTFETPPDGNFYGAFYSKSGKSPADYTQLGYAGPVHPLWSPFLPGLHSKDYNSSMVIKLQ
jgi:hypothetical protein